MHRHSTFQKMGKIPGRPQKSGGQGLALIHGMSKAIRYQRQGQRNITEIEF